MCNTSFNPPKPFLAATGVEVLDISTTGLVHINGPIALNCYTKLGDISTNYSTWINLDEKGPYRLSGSRNRLTAIGCNVVAYVTGSIGDNCTSGCVSLYSPNVLVVNGSCNGIECCQMSIPERQKHLVVAIESEVRIGECRATPSSWTRIGLNFLSRLY